MVARASKPCRKGGCTALCRDSTGYCPEHKHTGWEQHQQGRTSSERGYGAQWRKIRRLVIARDKGLCVMCKEEGRITPGVECDHIQPKDKGGSDALSNLRMLCVRHHRSVTGKQSIKHITAGAC